MGRVKNATVPYLASVLILAVATYAFYHGYTLLTDLIDNSFPILEVLVGFVYLCAVVKLYPILFVKTDLFIPFYNVAMYPPRRSNISKMEWANEMMRRKRQGKLPFSSKYPNGWFSVCRSTELGKGEVKPVNMLGMSNEFSKTFFGVLIVPENKVKVCIAWLCISSALANAV